MKKLLARYRTALIITSVAALAAVSTLRDHAFARAEDPPKPALSSGGTIEVQEEIMPYFLRFGPSSRRGDGDVYGIYKFSPFRVLKSDGSVSSWVELNIGHGGGKMTPATLDEASGVDATGRSLLNGKLFTSAESYTAVIRFVLTTEQLESVDQFISEMESVLLAEPDPMVTYRFVDGRWGDFRARKDTKGTLTLLVGKDEEGWECWEQIDAASFHSAIKFALQNLKMLNEKPVSATITAH